MFDFDTIVDRSASDSAKWRKYHGREIIPMWVADMDFPAPPAVIQALQQRVDHGVFGYGLPSRQLAQSIIDHVGQSFGWEIESHWIVWLPGLVSGLNAACRTVGKEGDRVLTTVPIYPPFLSAPGNAGRQSTTTPMLFDQGRWRIDMDHLESAIEADTRLFNLCNPHNPTGRVFTRRELTQLAQICERHDLTICSDEIHCDLVLEPTCRHLPIASIAPEIARRTITLMAPSKTFNIPGLSCAYAVISDDALRRRFKRAIDGIVPHNNVLGLVAAQAAFQNGREWLRELILYLRANRDLVHQTINGLSPFDMGPVEATYLAWIDARGCGVENPQRFFEEHGVGLSDGADFGAPRYVRLNFGCTRKLLQSALDRMVHALSAGKP
jgi:cysteine-S-conjugate beta-lyase